MSKLKEYKPTGFALEIFKDRYSLHPEETFPDACKRVSSFIASAEDGEKIKHFGDRFYNIMSTNKFSPGGRIWRGAGRKRSPMINCFLLPSGDSAEEWGELLKNVTIISSMGGGVGISFDNIRHRGALIRGKGGKATGAVSLMSIIDGICKELRSGAGRRSALLFGLSYHHPDIEEFLNVKLDKKELNNANISVLVDNHFFDLVESNQDVELKWDGQIIKTIKAKWIYNKIIENSLEIGDPGLINIGNAEKYNNLFYCRPISCTNPCVIKGTLIQTPDGFLSVEKIVIGDKILSGNKGFLPVTSIEHHKNMKVLFIYFDDGGHIGVTPSHQFVQKFNTETSTPTYIKADQLQINDKIISQTYENDISKYHSVKVIKITQSNDIFDVYDLYVKETDLWVTNNYLSRGCGEQQLSSESVCCLGNIVLPTHINENGQINYEMLDDTIRLGVRFLDNVLDVNEFPLESIKTISHQERRIGLGVMGLGHALIKMGVKYSSEEAINIIDKLFNFIKKKSYEASIFLAVEKSPFPLLDREKFITSGFCKTFLTPAIRKKILEYGIRNCCILTCPPTGTTSIVANTTSGIEPLFAAIFRRNFNKHNSKDNNVGLDSNEIIVDPLFKEFIEKNKDISVFENAHDISPEQHCKIQVVIQKHIDSALSKTINLPQETDMEDLSNIILKYIRDLKGITVYKEGSRGKSPLETLSVEEGKKYLDNAKVETQQANCKNGGCDI